MNRYLVMVMRNAGFDPALIPALQEFLAALRADECIELSGGFSDRSGGAYLLRAASMDAALAIAHRDPLHTAGASSVRVHEWNAT